MNILVVTECISTDREGGDCRFVSSLCREIAHAGHNVKILTRRSHPSHPAAENGNPSIERFPAPRRGSKAYFLYPLASLISALRSYMRIRKTSSLDVVFFHHPFSALGIVAFERLFRRQSPKFVLTFHSPKSAEYDAGLRFWNPLRWLIKFYAGTADKVVIRRMDAVVVLSEYMAGLLHKHCNNLASPVFRIPGGVDLERFRLADHPHDVRDRLGIPRNQLVFFTVRRLVRRMGLSTLIAAFSRLVQHYPDSLLLIGGRGILEQELKAQVADLDLGRNVRFIGFVEEADLPKFYQSSDFFILPTEKLEGFGLVILEAFACGIPVLGTPVGAIPNVIAGFDPTLVAASSTAVDLATLMESAINRLHDKGYPHEEYRGICEREFSWGSVADRYLDLFGKLVQSKDVGI